MLIIVPLLASACGGGSDDHGPTLTALVELDTSGIAQEDMDETTAQVIEIIEQRLRDLGASSVSAVSEETPTISFEFADLNADAARSAFEAGLLEFREPVLDDKGQVICEAAGGSQFTVAASSVSQGVTETGAKVAQCTGLAGEFGTVVWKSALAKDSAGETRQLTGRYLKANSAEVVLGVGECIPACVDLEFTGEGSLLFEQITTRLINFPLGIFLDEELIGSPNVRTVISNGQTIITGLSADDASTLPIQINSGALPVPTSLVSIGSTE